MSQSVCILGVTGSIGQSTLKILDQHPDDYSVLLFQHSVELKN